MSKREFWCHSVSTCCAVLPFVRETAFITVRACVGRFGSVIQSRIVSCNTSSDVRNQELVAPKEQIHPARSSTISNRIQLYSSQNPCCSTHQRVDNVAYCLLAFTPGLTHQRRPQGLARRVLTALMSIHPQDIYDRIQQVSYRLLNRPANILRRVPAWFASSTLVL
jgi:hypothetical protein